MAITLRATKGSPLTHNELDGNFTDLDTRLTTAESDVDTLQTGKVDLAGDTMTGPLNVPTVVMDSPFTFRNKIINGNFDIWQRGTSIALTAGAGYTADRWRGSNSVGTATITQQSFTLGQTDVPGNPTYFLRYASTGGASLNIRQRIEDVRTFAGKTITISFYAKADTAQTVTLYADQYFGTGGSPSATVSQNTTLNITTSWQRFTASFTLGSLSGKTLGSDGNDTLEIVWFKSATSFTFDLSQVQVEEGSVTTPFEQRPEVVEFNLCRRFLQFPSGDCIGFATGATTIAVLVPIPIRFRATPSVSLKSTTLSGSECPWFGAIATNTSAAIVSSGDVHYGTDFIGIQVSGFAGLTANTRAMIRGDEFIFDAEL